MSRVKGTNKTVAMVNVLMTSFMSCDDIYATATVRTRPGNFRDVNAWLTLNEKLMRFSEMPANISMLVKTYSIWS